MRLAAVSSCLNLYGITYQFEAKSRTYPLQGQRGQYLLALIVPMDVEDSSVLSPTLFAVYINDIVSQLQFSVHHFTVLYADDIILMTPPVTEL